jgi:HSP20 family protein
MDVLETTAGIELVVDLPGVPRSAINVVFAQGALIVAGRKRPASCTDGEAAFHLVERNFGRFARAVHLKGAFDTGKATATLEAGELRIFLPRIEERRGRDRRIEIASS